MKRSTRLTLLVLCAAALLPFGMRANAAVSGGTAILVANVNLVSVESVERNGIISGQFSLQGNMGEQNNIVYGIEARDKNNAIVDAKKLGEEKSIKEGETKQYQFTYTVPAALRGSVSILLVAETESGLMLALHELAHKTYQGTGGAFSCAPGTAASVTCTASAATSLTASYVQGSVFANSVSTESKSVQKGSQASFTPALAPGNYFALVTDTNHTRTVAVPFSVLGNYGSIQNVVVTDKKDGTLAVVLLATAVPSAGASVSVALTDSGGSACGSETVPLAGNVISLTLASSCKQGTATVTLLGADKSTLATSITSFSTQVVGAEAATTESSQMSTLQKYLLAGGILLLLALAGVGLFLLRKKSVPPVVMILLFAATLLGGAHHASAATYAIGGNMGVYGKALQYEDCLAPYSWKSGESGCADPGNWYDAYTTYGTVTVPDSVAPGSSYSIGISGSLNNPTDAVTGGGYTTECYYSTGTSACGPTNVETDVYRSLPLPSAPGYNTCAGYTGCQPIPSTASYVGGVTYPTTSGTVTATAPSSGSSDVLAFVQSPAAPVGYGCVGGKANCWTYFKSYNSISIPIAYTVTGSAGTGGTISPASQNVNYGSATALTVTPNSGYSIASASGCGGSLSGSTFTTGSVTANCAVTATFTLVAIPVNGTCGTANGTAYAYGSSSYSPYAQCGNGSPSTTAFPTAGSSQTWTCSGTNGGSASGTCSASQNAPASCTTPWGSTLASGSSVTAYQSSSATSPTKCSSISETRTCSNGSLSGSYTYQSCTDLTPVNGTCGTANGVTYPNGSTGYSPYTQCTNGTPSTTTFPAPATTQTWTCSGQNSGSPASCSASQTGNPCAATTISNCRLSATASGSSAGSCAANYSGSCSYSCANGTWSVNSNSCTALPDLTAGNTSVSPASGITNQAESFSGTVSNIGIGTASNFPNIIQIANSAITATIAMLNAGTVASLAPNASTPVSAAYTFSSPGSYNIRTCANENTSWAGSVAETNPNNNCGAWQTLTVSYPTLAASCSGTPGNPYTGQAVTWTSLVASGTGSYTYSWSGTDGLSGTTASVSKVYTTTGQKSATVTVTDTVSGQTVSPSCTTGANQPNGPTNGGTCSTGVCPGSCTSSLTASPSTVEQGQNVSLSWSVTGGTLCATACTGNGFTTGGATAGTNVPASVPPAPPTTPYGLSCTGGSYGPPPATNTTVTVLVPTVTITANGQSTTARVNPTTPNNTNIVWSSANSSSCSATKNGAAWKTGLSGNVTESVFAQTLYKIDCVNNYGTHAVGTVLVNLLPAYQKF